MPTRTITLFSPFLGLVSGSGDASLTLTDADDGFFEIPDQTGNNQSASLDGSPVTVNAIEEAIGPQLVTALVGGVSVQLSLTPVRITIESGIVDDQYIFFPDLPDGAEITVGLSVPALFPSDVDVPLCLSADTLIRTPGGLRPARDIRPGDLVETVDDGPQRVLWTGMRRVDFRKESHLAKHRPYVIRKDAFGTGQPFRDLILSPQHSVAFASWEAEYLTGEAEGLAPARNLENGTTVARMGTCDHVDYWHVLFDRHQIIWAQGLTVESLFLGDIAADCISEGAKEEFEELFPDREVLKLNFRHRVRARLRAHEAAVMMHTLNMNQSFAR